jgi:hypothetical protein
MHTARYVASVVMVAGVGLLGWNSGCSSSPTGGTSDDGGGSGSGSSSGGGGSGLITMPEGGSSGATTGGTHACSMDGNVCTNLCPSVGSTVITGKVFDPAGNNPVYGAAVWVPYTKPSPMPVPITCNCSELYTGGFVGAYDVTKADGTFTILNAPSAKMGGSVPIVVQVGKWRYQTTIPVTCGMPNNVQDRSLRLPQGAATTGVMYPGDLPNIAISTGSADTLECLLRRVGVTDKEYVAGPVTPGGPHIHIYEGAKQGVAPNTQPGAPSSPAMLWDTAAHLSQFDAVLLSCEGAPTTLPNASSLIGYGGVGGRVFASHFHYQWFLDMMGMAPNPNFGTWYTQHSNFLATAEGTIQTKLPNGNMFTEGQALKDFLVATNALDSSGELVVYQSRHNVDVSLSTPQDAVPWINFDPAKSTFQPGTTNDPLVTGPTLNSTLYFSYDPPGAGTETNCGRFVYSDLHVGGNSGDYGESNMAASPPAGGIVPGGCNGGVALSNQEKALEFMLFDLTSCLSPIGNDAGVTKKGVPF